GITAEGGGAEESAGSDGDALASAGAGVDAGAAFIAAGAGIAAGDGGSTGSCFTEPVISCSVSARARRSPMMAFASMTDFAVTVGPASIVSKAGGESGNGLATNTASTFGSGSTCKMRFASCTDSASVSGRCGSDIGIVTGSGRALGRPGPENVGPLAA